MDAHFRRITTSELFRQAYGRYGLAAVNVFCMEQIHGLFHAAQTAEAPFIIQITPAARQYAHPKMLNRMIEAAAEIYPDTVFAVHLDHGTIEHCLDAIAFQAYSSIMIDASHESFRENIKITRGIVERAHDKGIPVEAELGVLSGVEDDLQLEEAEAKFTDPDQVEEFVHRTECDSLAIAVGTSHGAYKFSEKKGIQFRILEKIQKRLPNFPLVLHGASAVRPDEIQRINKTGGRLSQTAQGVENEELQRAIGLGVCKVNIATDLRLLWTRIHREFFHRHPDQIDLVAPGKQYMEEIQNLMLAKFKMLGSAGTANDFFLKPHKAKSA